MKWSVDKSEYFIESSEILRPFFSVGKFAAQSFDECVGIKRDIKPRVKRRKFPYTPPLKAI